MSDIIQISNGGCNLSNKDCSDVYSLIHNNSISVAYTINLSDKPTGYDGILHIIKIDNSYGRLFFYSNNGKVFTRVKSAGVLSSWIEIV